MERIKALWNQPWVAAGIAFVVGLFIGLVVLGWWLWPVKWTDAAPAHLRADYQEDYLRMAIDSFELRGDVGLAQRRFQALGEAGPALLATIRQNPGEQSPAAIESFASIVQAPQPLPGTGEGTPAPTTAPSARGRSTAVLLLLCGVILLVAVAVVLLFITRGRLLRRAKGPETPAQVAQTLTQEAAFTDYAAEGREPPLAQFMTTYVLGDDLYDDSFSIDSPSGEFLGECGVGISDTIGVGEPKKVSAFEVWLFDKNDIQTVTKVLMSPHAYRDEATRQRLEAKGDPVLAQPGQEFILETARLQMVARIIDLQFGEGALPEESYFERLTLELAIWPKQ